FLAFNDSERGIGTGFSARRQLLDPLANFIKHRSFGQTLPSRNQAHGGDGILLRFFSRFEDGIGIDKTVARRSSIVGGGLCAEAAIFRTAASLGVDDGAEMDLVAFESFANP